MARLEETSDTESAVGQVKAVGAAVVHDDTSEPEATVNKSQDDENEDEDGEDEEYEIEAILGAKKGIFPKGRTGYLVKWKGYDDTHNTYVDEDDAGNAIDLIDEYWRKQKKEKHKSAEKARKSLPKDTSSDVASTSAAKKRARKSKAQEDSDAEMDREDEVPVKKKSRRSNGVSRSPVDEYLGDQVYDENNKPIGNMSKWMKTKSWEHIIKEVDTVERVDDGTLYVYFTLTKDGGRFREESKLCAERFPQKMIQFYESNLRWRHSDGPPTTVENS